MNRFSQKNYSSHLLRRILTTAAVTVCAIALLILGTDSVRRSADSSQMDSLRLAIVRSAVHCYAMEGKYPESLDYIRDHYGISWDEKKYIVDYEITGANMMPDVAVFSIKDKEAPPHASQTQKSLH